MPRFREAASHFCSCFPESFFPGSTPAKAVSEAILEYCDLGNKPFDQRFIELCDGGLLSDKILQVLDQAHSLILFAEHLIDGLNG